MKYAFVFTFVLIFSAPAVVGQERIAPVIDHTQDLHTIDITPTPAPYTNQNYYTTTNQTSSASFSNSNGNGNSNDGSSHYSLQLQQEATEFVREKLNAVIAYDLPISDKMRTINRD